MGNHWWLIISTVIIMVIKVRMWLRRRRPKLQSPSARKANAWRCTSFCRCSSAATAGRASSTASTRSSATARGQNTHLLRRRATWIHRNRRQRCPSWWVRLPVVTARARNDRSVAIKSPRHLTQPRTYTNTFFRVSSTSSLSLMSLSLFV